MVVPPPPYDYQLPGCDDEVLVYSPGPLLCRPGEGDEEEDEIICCEPITIRDSANIYREMVLQRDLFNPNTKTNSGRILTIKDMAVLKGLKPSLYNAYARNFYTGALRAIPINTTVTTKMSVVLIEIEFDTKPTRERIGRELMRKPNILPSRMSWNKPLV